MGLSLRLSATLMLAALSGLCPVTRAAAPSLFRTAGYQAPVRGDPDDLLMLAGTGFHATDRVVYAAAQADRKTVKHPDPIPPSATALLGTAQIVARADPAYAITVRLPVPMQSGRPYYLWVVTERGEWSLPVSINDPRPLWFSPAYAWSTADIAGLGRSLRVIGRNLSTAYGRVRQIRLRGPATYRLAAEPGQAGARALPLYVASASLPPRLLPGLYTISIRRSDTDWIEVPDQKFEVRADAPPAQVLRLDDPAFGNCHADDGADDSRCLVAAISAAARAGGADILIPRGNWRLAGTTLAGSDGFTLPPGVNLTGVGNDGSSITRTDSLRPGPRVALLTLTGRNTVSGITFVDDAPFTSMSDARPVLRLGPVGRAPPVPSVATGISDIVISGNRFARAGRAIADDGGWPIARLMMSHNEFAAFAESLSLAGENMRPGLAFRIDDSVVRSNRFIPGSYLDLPARQGTIASEIGAADRLDFSGNVADGADVRGLRSPTDAKGFRAAFFWNMNNNLERMLVSRNRISCAGDKDGDGEALAFDDSGSHTGFAGAQPVKGAGVDWVRVRGTRLLTGRWHALPVESYYLGQWVQVVDGVGVGQVRRIIGYTEDPATGTVTIRVAPGWDVVPAGAAARIQVARELWQAAVVDNDIESGAPTCRKSNLTDSASGQISVWLPTADSVIEGNIQHDSSGILFKQTYQANTPSCPTCENSLSLQSALEIRDNRIDGEYDWTSDCSQSGIIGSYAASPTPESPPPILGFGVSIAHNLIIHADGLRGGAIDLVPTWYTGPPPGHWKLIENPLIFHNQIQDIAGSAPRPLCHRGQNNRTAIQLGEPDNVADAVLMGNSCRRVAVKLNDHGHATTKICAPNATGTCEC